MTRIELENFNAELIAVLKAVRDQIDETLESFDEDEDGDHGDLDDDEADDEE